LWRLRWRRNVVIVDDALLPHRGLGRRFPCW
jgi:hypothetical protein